MCRMSSSDDLPIDLMIFRTVGGSASSFLAESSLATLAASTRLRSSSHPCKSVAESRVNFSASLSLGVADIWTTANRRGKEPEWSSATWSSVSAKGTLRWTSSRMTKQSFPAIPAWIGLMPAVTPYPRNNRREPNWSTVVTKTQG